MKILLVSATEREIEPLLKKITIVRDGGAALRICRYKKMDVDVLISGIGMVSTAYSCAKTISDAYDIALNAGIAGSFRKEIAIGETVNVSYDLFSELGAEDGEKLLSLHEMKLDGEDFVENRSDIKNAALNSLRKVKGITVNTVHGKESSIKNIVERFNPDIETMEGAAFLFACKHEGIPCAQIRTVSNYIEKRDRTKWEIGLSIKNLNETLEKIFSAF